MSDNKEIYEELSNKYSDEELVEGYLINETLASSEQKEAEEEFRKIRAEELRNMSVREILLGKILQMKFSLKAYFKEDKFDPNFSFASQLKHYIAITKRSNREIAENLDIHPTKLSRLLNEKENPNIDLMYRLEKHSSEEIPAHYWWRLYSRQFENKIKTDLEKRLDEGSKVKGQIVI